MVRRIFVVSSLLFANTALAYADPRVNDTGQLNCFNDAAVAGAVAPATPDPEPVGFGEQDCTRGASAADALGVQIKIGGASTRGRDYTKIANDGSELPSTALLGTASSSWGCVRDNVTGLVWEIKTNDNGLRDRDHTYTWFDSDSGINAGEAGDAGANTCNATLPSNQCNTTAYRDAINARSGSSRLCGQTDWRLPTLKELQSLVDYGRSSPAIDTTWLPNTVGLSYWSGTSHVSTQFQTAFLIDFGSGEVGFIGKGIANPVRLVRGGF